MAIVKTILSPFRISLFAVLIILPCILSESQAQTQPSQEYQIKAVFLFNFSQFVEWPGNAFPNPDTPLVIGVLGKDPFGSYLDETVRNERVHDHPLAVKRFSKWEDVKECHILFINITEKDKLKDIFENLKNQNVLTVGDAPNFSKNGGMIRFITENNKIRLRVNLEVVKDAELTISAKLLRMAEIVSTK